LLYYLTTYSFLTFYIKRPEFIKFINPCTVVLSKLISSHCPALMSPEQIRLTHLKANVDRQKEALKRERENQKRQKEAEHRCRNLGGV